MNYCDAAPFVDPNIEYEPSSVRYDHTTPDINATSNVQATFTSNDRTLGFTDDLAAEYEAPTKSNTLCSKQAKEIEPSFSVGTTWGNEIKDKTTKVEFKRGSTRAEFEMFYGSKKDLKKTGVSFEKKSKVSFPSAFGKFAKPPQRIRTLNNTLIL